MVGAVQKVINRQIFDIHMPLDSMMLRQAHEKASFTPVFCDYFIITNFGVCNLGVNPNISLAWLAKKLLLTGLLGFSVTMWFMEGIVGKFRATKTLSAYISCAAIKS